MLNRNKLFSQLFGAFLERFTNVEALIVSDFEGLIIAGEKREEVNLELVSVLTTMVNPILSRIRTEYSFHTFGTSSFDTDEYRLCNGTGRRRRPGWRGRIRVVRSADSDVRHILLSADSTPAEKDQTTSEVHIRTEAGRNGGHQCRHHRNHQEYQRQVCHT